MSPKRVKNVRKRRGAQKWILSTLREMNPSETLSTSKIAKRIQKASGKAFHKNSVYNALRILVHDGALKVVRAGHEKTYQVSGAAPPAPRSTPRPRTTPAMSSPPVAESIAIPEPTPATPAVTPAALPHKLALGEILVIRVEGDEVVTATNLHGQLVLERHPLPA